MPTAKGPRIGEQRDRAARRAKAKGKGSTGTRGKGKRVVSLETSREQVALREQGYCAALKKDGKCCRKREGWGTKHAGYGLCKLHGGNSPNGTVNARGIEAARLVEQYGLPREIDPHEALLEELARTAGHVDWLRVQIGEIEEAALVGPVGQEGTGKDGTTHHPEGKPNAWLALYQEERKHLVSVAGACAKAGIEERRVRIAEEQGQMIARVLRSVLVKLGVDPADRRVGTIVRDELMAINGRGSEVVRSEEADNPDRNGRDSKKLGK